MAGGSSREEEAVGAEAAAGRTASDDEGVTADAACHRERAIHWLGTGVCCFLFSFFFSPVSRFFIYLFRLGSRLSLLPIFKRATAFV